MSDVMSVRLHLSGVGVTGVGVDSVERLEVEVEVAREWSRCRHCGFRCYRVWDRRPKRVRDLGVSGRRTTLVWRRRRFECGNCGERHLQDHALFGAGLTRRFARRLVADATVMSMSGSVSPSRGWVASDHGLGPRGGGSGGAASPRPAVSCAVGRRNVDTAPSPVCDCGRLWRQRQRCLAMIPGRTKGSLSRFFRDQGAWWCRQVEIVVSDGILLIPSCHRAVSSRCSPCVGPVPRRPLVHPRPHPGTTRDTTPRPPPASPNIRTGPVPKPVSPSCAEPTILTEAHQAHPDRLFDAHPRLRTDRDALSKSSTSYTKPTTPTSANQALVS